MRGDTDQGLPGTGRRGEYDVVTAEQLENGLFLRGIEREADIGGVFEKDVE